MKYFVSRQNYWPDGEYFVEIVKGGSDFANADMLSPKFSYLGECREFTNPKEAVEAAIKIKLKWIETSEEEIHLGYGSTGGFTMPFDSCTDQEAIEWAEKEYEKLPKCDYCNNIVDDNKWWEDDFGDMKFCSENCCSQYHIQMHKSGA